ncbi:MAG: TfoX/Sxy family protein [Xanthobacteraceae bacterium]|nr:TfoX/Sxy family protein [Xanthobacteraceae bacterium]
MAKVAGPESWDRDHLLDLFSAFGPIGLRRMFSGFGISADGVNFAMALRAGVIFRVDDATVEKYEAEGAPPFQYTTSKKTVVVQSYRHIPERLYDDAEEFAVWAREALGAARRAKTKTGVGKAGQAAENSKRSPKLARKSNRGASSRRKSAGSRRQAT